MWSSSKPALVLLDIAVLLVTLFTAGCMCDSPSETDMPWSAPAAWEGTMPLPSGYMDRYQ